MWYKCKTHTLHINCDKTKFQSFIVSYSNELKRNLCGSEMIISVRYQHTSNWYDQNWSHCLHYWEPIHWIGVIKFRLVPSEPVRSGKSHQNQCLWPFLQRHCGWSMGSEKVDAVLAHRTSRGIFPKHVLEKWLKHTDSRAGKTQVLTNTCP